VLVANRRSPLYEREIAEAIQSRDAELLRQRTGRLREHAMRVLDRVGVLRHPARADRLIREGRRARDADEQERLRSINMELQGLLTEPLPQPPDLSDISTVQSAG
jgi:molecular chaperone DnaK